MKFTPYIFLLALFFALPAALSAQCGPGEDHVRFEIDPDQYWNEVSWKFTDVSGSSVYGEGLCQNDLFHTYDYCVPQGQCIVFSIKDEYGDGIYPDGYYKVYVNDTLIHTGGPNYNYHFGESFRFGCPPGGYCDVALNLPAPGTYTTPSAQETWYSFTPADTGTFVITTCDLGNTCASKIWVYDKCNGITVSENQTGAIFYANEGCAAGATATLYLAGGKEYFIRLKYTNGICNDAPLNFSLNYVGPVVGCTDPTSCNYNPLATVSGDCLYPGDPNCPNAPDLVVLQNTLKNSLALDFIQNGDACMVEEGCIKGVGNRYLVRFTTHIQNIGNTDYFIGQTPVNPNVPSTQFVWDPCHNHWHYRGYAEYLLYNGAGVVVPVGTKNGFCVLDLECNNGGLGQYTCTNMGITAGCGDIYDASLPCQWVDITGLSEGTYTLVVRVNWDKSPDKLGRVEKDYNNNWAQTCFNLTYNGATPSIEVLDDDCPSYVDCLGEPFGSAVTDCQGLCNGPTLYGDWNQDSVRNDLDVQAYLSASLSDDQPATTCRDLFDDDQLNVYDAAMLQECTLHHDDLTYWGLRYPCQFPSGFDNDQDIVYLLPGALDTVAKTFDVKVVNPYNKLIGYEFSVTGLQIASVESLDAAFDGVHQFDAGGEILALSPTETAISKNILPTDMLRIHYSKLTAPEVCISQITAVVNNKYQLSNAQVATPACVSTGLVGTHAPEQAFDVFVQPNPFKETVTLFFSNPAGEAAGAYLYDMTGRAVRQFEGLRTEQVTFKRDDLPAGVYRYEVRIGQSRVSGKVVAQ